MNTLLSWSARLSGAFMVAMTLLIAIGEGMPNPFVTPWVVGIGFLSLAFILLGTLLAWRWEITGGLVSLCAWVLFALAENINWRHANFFILMALPGFLFLCSGLLRRYARSRGN